ncbi:unnamed protein product, partial [Hydatigera taeniaeformis]|uniref:Neur_chan_LBD domain-containing protein n=1 Tax=Hydatigena taeniaeformis TaxID=6205 RepID=A0A0R3WRB0_HYDTA
MLEMCSFVLNSPCLPAIGQSTNQNAAFSTLQNPKVRNLFEFHVADLKLPPEGSMNLSSCCLPGTWIPPDLCFSQCRILLEVDLKPGGETYNTSVTSSTVKSSVFRTGVL